MRNPFRARPRRWLIVSHRYLGLALSPLFVIWFISGIGMIYARGMPGLTQDERLHRLPPVDFGAVNWSAAQAAESVGLEGSLFATTLLTVMGRPAYRLIGSSQATVFADTGEPLRSLGPQEATEVASEYLQLPIERLRYEGLLAEADQWTLVQRPALPLHKLTADDGRGTQLYVSPRSAEVLVLTTRASRALAWVAAIPHWLYITPLRTNDELWRRVVIWAAALGCLVAIMGLALGLVQFRFSRPFRLARIPAYVPYTGLMRWHYVSGALFGVFTLTWVFSGLLSMEPMGWASGEGLAAEVVLDGLRGGPLAIGSFPRHDAAAWARLLPSRQIKEVQFARVLGRPYYRVRMTGRVPFGELRSAGSLVDGGPGGASTAVLSAESLMARRGPFPVDSLLSSIRSARPEAQIVEAQLLDDYDSYHYSRDGAAPLPILRVKFDDPVRTWFYIDPMLGTLASSLHRLDRVERWIYNGFHSLDFGFWYGRRPTWELGVILLSLGGLATTAIGLFVGARRLARIGRARQRPAA